MTNEELIILIQNKFKKKKAIPCVYDFRYREIRQIQISFGSLKNALNVANIPVSQSKALSQQQLIETIRGALFTGHHVTDCIDNQTLEEQITISFGSWNHFKEILNKNIPVQYYKILGF